MLSYNTLIITLILIIALVLLFCFIKSFAFRIFVIVFAYCVILVFTAFAYVQVDNYYNASGGIFGELNSIINPNTAKVNEMTIKVENLVLTETTNDNEFSATIELSDSLELTKDTRYMILINGVPTQLIDGSVDFVTCVYDYKFYDNNQNCFEDELKIQFAFYNNKTTITLITNGGSTAVEYWNYYFNVNNFDITISPILTNINETTNNIYEDYEILTNNLCCVRYLNADGFSIFAHNDYVNGSMLIKSVDTPIKDGYSFVGWSLDGITLIDTSFVVTEDISLKPVFQANVYVATFYDYDGNIIATDNYSHGETIDFTKYNDYKPTSGGTYGWAIMYEDGTMTNVKLPYIISGNVSFRIIKTSSVM